MKKLVLITIIIAIVVLLVIGIFVYKKISTGTGKSIDYGAIDVGGALGGATTTNAFEQVKTNPFDSKNG
jgi:preprotein translocase subunit SecG